MRKSPQKFTPEMLAPVKKLLKEGVGYHAASKLTGIPSRVVYYHFKPGAKEVQRKITKKWQENNLERHRHNMKMLARRYRAANPSKAREVSKKSYIKNAERCRARAAAYRKAHPDKVIAWRKEYQRRKTAKRLRIEAMMDSMRKIVDNSTTYAHYDSITPSTYPSLHESPTNHRHPLRPRQARRAGRKTKLL